MNALLMNEERRRWAMLGLAAVFVALFWTAAWGCDWFSDAPYLMPSLETAATIGSPRFITLHEAALALAAAVFLLPAVVLVGRALGSMSSPLERLRNLVRDDERAVPVISTAIAIAGAAFVSYALIDQTDIIDDERAYLFEAKLFAHGRVADPGLPAALRNQMFITHPVLASKYAPGNSALLAIGTFLKQPHVIHPILAGVLVWAIYSFARQAFGRNVAILSCALAAVSPFLWCIDGTVMAFGAAAAALAVALAGLARLVDTGSRRAGLVAGAALAALVTIRYFESVVVVGSVALWLAYLLLTKRIRWTSLVPVAVAFCALAWVPLWFNHALTGSMWKTGYALEPNPIRLGFGRSFIGSYEHTLGRGVASVLTNLLRVDSWLLGLPGALVLVGIGVLRRGGPFDVLLRILFFSFFAAFVLVPGPGTWDVGPTYAFCAFPVLVALAARGFQSIHAFARGHDAHVACEWGAVAFVALGAMTLTPLRLYRVADLASAIQSPWEAIAQSDAEGVVVVPPIRARAAAGWGYGYPYEIETTKQKTVHLAMPLHRDEYDEVMRYFGATSALTLKLDAERFKTSGKRHFAIVPFNPAAAWPSNSP